jgi:inhibitor of KinA
MTNEPTPRYLTAGESALVVEFGAVIDPKIHDCVLALDAVVQQANIEGITETVPSYRSLMIHFDPRILTTETLITVLARLVTPSNSARRRRHRWHIPACYDPHYGEDIAEIASLLNLPPARIIDLHQGVCYRVYMYGFAPGFTFLGGLPPELTIPRRAVPRAPAPPGSLLIAAGQALIASCAMPTGWYAIGRTPVKVFDPKREPICLAGIGDEICFERIDAAAFDVLSVAAEAGEVCAYRDVLEES